MWKRSSRNRSFLKVAARVRTGRGPAYRAFCNLPDDMLYFQLRRYIFHLGPDKLFSDHVQYVPADTAGISNRNRALDNHDGFWVVLNGQLNHSLNRACIKEILLAVVISALKFVRRSCSTVAYKAHLLPYVATYPLFRA